MFYLNIVAMLLVLVPQSQTIAQEVDEKNRIQVKALKKLWFKNDAKLINGEFRVRLFRASGVSLKGHSVESLERLFTTNSESKLLENVLKEKFFSEFKKNAENFKAGSVPFWGKIVDVAYDGAYLKNTILTENQPVLLPSFKKIHTKNDFNTLERKTTENHAKPEQDLIEADRICYYSPKGIVEYNPAFGTFLLMAKSSREHFDRYTLKFSPQFEPDGNFIATQELENGLLEIQMSNDRKMLVDPASGFVKRFVRGSKNDGVVRIHCSPFELLPGVCYPRVQLRCIFKKGVLESFFLTEIVDSVSNVNLDPSLFRVIGLPGDRIVDYRNGEENAGVYDISSSTEDVFSIAETRANSPIKPEPIIDTEPTNESNSFFYFVVLCMAATVATWFVVRRGKFNSSSGEIK